MKHRYALRAILAAATIILVSLGLVAFASPALGQPAGKAVVLVHGGGFCAGGPGYMEPLAERIRRSGYVVYNISYSTQCPGFDHQVRAVESAIIDAKLRHEQVVVWGHSAGGTLAATAAVRGRVVVDAFVGYSGAYDFQQAWRYPHLTHVAEQYLGCRPMPWRFACYHLAGIASPERYASVDDAPSILVNASRFDIPIEQRDGMAKALAQNMVPVAVITPRSGHGPYTYAPDPFDEVMRYLDRYLAA